MARRTRLAPTDVAAIAARFDLGRVVGFSPLDAGTISSNFDVRTERGRFFVRVNDGKHADQVAWEADLVVAIAGAGVPAPPPLPARDGRRFAIHGGQPVSVFAWQPGVHLGADQVTPDHAATLGAALAGFHGAAAARPRSTWREGIYQLPAIVARFERVRALGDPALERAVTVLADELPWLVAQAPVRAAASHGLIHGDLFRDNVLWDGERLVALLDFEQASRGTLVYDLAVAINDWCWTGQPRRDLVGALLDGYQRVRALTEADRAALAVELRTAAARFTITRITDVHMRQADMPDKDFRDFLARLEVWRSGGVGAVLSSV